ncbi:MAG: HD domain-containing protein [Candidatus Moranbacteria bacterium]|nr:HD domain-containing protein [Candidatus Moranbacteria bacterium]
MKKEYLSHPIERAIAFILKVHGGESDKGGNPYLLHPLSVAVGIRDPEVQIAAVLHDTIEKGATEEELRSETGASKRSVHIVSAVSMVGPVPTDDDEYLRFYERYVVQLLEAGREDVGVLVLKTSDVSNNLDLSRIERPTPWDLSRNSRYQDVFVRCVERLFEVEEANIRDLLEHGDASVLEKHYVPERVGFLAELYRKTRRALETER